MKPEKMQPKKTRHQHSQVCEQRLREEIQAHKREHWNEEHADFLSIYNNMVEAEGVALQEWHSF